MVLKWIIIQKLIFAKKRNKMKNLQSSATFETIWWVELLEIYILCKVNKSQKKEVEFD